MKPAPIMANAKQASLFERFIPQQVHRKSTIGGIVKKAWAHKIRTCENKGGDMRALAAGKPSFSIHREITPAFIAQTCGKRAEQEQAVHLIGKASGHAR